MGGRPLCDLLQGRRPPVATERKGLADVASARVVRRRGAGELGLKKTSYCREIDEISIEGGTIIQIPRSGPMKDFSPGKSAKANSHRKKKRRHGVPSSQASFAP